MTTNDLTKVAGDQEWTQIVEQLISEIKDENLPDKVLEATEYLLCGYTIREAAKAVGTRPDIVRGWMTEYPTMTRIVGEGRPLLTKWRMGKLEHQFLKAIKKSQEVLALDLYDHDVNTKLVGMVAQHARYLIGLFAGTKVDVNVNVKADPSFKATSDALQYIAEAMQQQRQTGDVVEVNYQVMDTRAPEAGPLLLPDGNPNHGRLGILDRNDAGKVLCHICGKYIGAEDLCTHVNRDHAIKPEDYEITFMLNVGDLERLNSGEAKTDWDQSG